MAPKSPIDERWRAKFRQLKAFHKKHGHCRVGYSNTALTSWLWRQRKAYNEYQMMKRGITPPTLGKLRLDEEQTKLLESVNVIDSKTKEEKVKRAVPRVSISETEASSTTREREDQRDEDSHKDDENRNPPVVNVGVYCKYTQTVEEKHDQRKLKSDSKPNRHQ